MTKDGRKLKNWGNTGPEGLDHRPPLAGPALGLTCHRALDPAEADLAKIQVSMVGADVTEDAGDRAPDTIVEALGRVGMHAAANILALRMAVSIR